MLKRVTEVKINERGRRWAGSQDKDVNDGDGSASRSVEMNS